MSTFKKCYELSKLTAGCCWYCGIDIIWNENTGNFHRQGYSLDHLVPRIVGGTNDPSNLVVACRKCNSEKGTLSLEQYRVAAQKKKAGWPKFTGEQLAWIEGNVGELPSLNPLEFWGESRPPNNNT